MKKTSLVTILLLSTVFIFGQHEFRGGQHKGYIITKDGKQKGIIWLDGPENAPWSHQKKVLFITEDDFNKMKKNKRKYFDSYKPKAIKGYGFGDAEFQSVKYADLSAVGPDMLPKMYFLKLLAKGTLSLFRFYKTPPSVRSGEDINKTNEEWALDNEMLVKKGEDKTKSIDRIDMFEILKDCKSVRTKYLDGGYGFKPKNDGEIRGLGKLWAKMSDRTKIEDTFVGIANDYNKCK